MNQLNWGQLWNHTMQVWSSVLRRMFTRSFEYKTKEPLSEPPTTSDSFITLIFLIVKHSKRGAG